jgi:hypothetical protein
VAARVDRSSQSVLEGEVAEMTDCPNTGCGSGTVDDTGSCSVCSQSVRRLTPVPGKPGVYVAAQSSSVFLMPPILLMPPPRRE